MKKTGDRLSILGFGCMRLPEKRGRIDEERATRQIRDSIDRGVNYVDTAVTYHMGASEPFLGRALSNGYREKVKVATKLPHWLVHEPKDMERILSSQLDKLKTACIEYYLMHNIDGETWQRMKTLGAAEFLNKAKADGRIAHAGFSFHNSRDQFRKIVDDYDWDFCQIQYNFLDQENQAGTEGLRYAASKGLGVIIMEPLRGGSLTAPIPPSVQAIWDEAQTKRTPAEWALRWIWNHPEVTLVLSGMNQEDHIAENIGIADQAFPESLTKAELDFVDRVEQTYRKLMKTGCTGCRYCMPCPSGVNIPSCFEHYDTFHMFAKKGSYKLVYAFWQSGISDGKPSLASQCTECGACLEKCPQQLAIPEHPMACKAEFETAIASAPSIMALAKSSGSLNPPVITKAMSFLPMASKYFLALANAAIVGTLILSLSMVGADPVPPPRPSSIM